MTIQSYAHSELSRIEGSSAYRGYVFDILKIISKEGHSGGSMGIFSGMFNHWAKEPKELKDNKLFSPIWNIVKDIPYGLVSITLSTVGKLMTYTPLTMLTGEDDEWGQLDYDDDVKFQHKRMSNIFKDSDGRAYWVDGVVYYEPTDFYSDWVGLTGSYSRVYIDFPFDPNTEPKRVYWTDGARVKQLDDDVDKMVWLEDRKNSAFLGFNPDTETFNTNSYCVPKEKINELLYHLKRYSLLKFDTSEDALWLRDSFLLEPKHTLCIDPAEYKSLDMDKPFVFSERSVWLNWLRIITECRFDFTIEGLHIQCRNPARQITLTERDVFVSSRNFQNLEKTDKVWLSSVRSFPDVFIVDDNGIAEFSQDKKKYLFQKCKQFSLKFKQPKSNREGSDE